MVGRLFGRATTATLAQISARMAVVSSSIIFDLIDLQWVVHNMQFKCSSLDTPRWGAGYSFIRAPQNQRSLYLILVSKSTPINRSLVIEEVDTHLCYGQI